MKECKHDFVEDMVKKHRYVITQDMKQKQMHFRTTKYWKCITCGWRVRVWTERKSKKWVREN